MLHFELKIPVITVKRRWAIEENIWIYLTMFEDLTIFAEVFLWTEHFARGMKL